VPANKVAYNKAAGAEQKERSLRSYVLGYYKSERNETGTTAKPVALRDPNNYTVILGVFHNAGYKQTVTLAQVFWIKDQAKQPERFFVGAERVLSITKDFSGFGSNINTLRQRLRKNNCEVMERFPKYGAWFRRRFGIENEQALELFHQTVSMKSVGNLTHFVRSHMLEPFAIEQRIDALKTHFDDLNRAYESVLKARQQIEYLMPLIADCDSYQENVAAVERFRDCRDALLPYFSKIKVELLKKRLDTLYLELQRHQNKKGKLMTDVDQQQMAREELKQQIAENGGDRIERLGQEIRQQEGERERRWQKAHRYQALLAPLSLEAATTVDMFLQQQTALHNQQQQLLDAQTNNHNLLREKEFDLRCKREEHNTLQQTIQHLKSRRSNIDQAQVEIRTLLCQALHLKESALPFVGELLQVHENEKSWQGAIERLMRSFGLSMLVPDQYYQAVAEWVDETNLRGRLVYYRVRKKDYRVPLNLHENSLVHKIEIKQDSSLDRVLPVSDPHEKRFAERYGFCSKPNYVRFRLLDPQYTLLPGKDQEFSLTANDFQALPGKEDFLCHIKHVFIVENEINFLSFPAQAKSMVMFGAGYGFKALKTVTWLQQRALYYWGDIDTHGFAILNQLRHVFSDVQSFLMDEATLLSHRAFWGCEEKQIKSVLPRLTPAEQAVYQALLHHDYAKNLRLEQERISYGNVLHGNVLHCALQCTLGLLH
jgi:uncharacterized protein YPO0396